MAGARKPGSGQQSSKAQLKAIGEALKQQHYDDAIEQARAVLEGDPQSHQALIFLGFALDKTDKLDEAIVAYEKAADVKPADPQAWQGLIKVYEKQGAQAIPKYKVAALRLAEIFRDVDEMYKCQVVVDTFLDFARDKGGGMQLADALEIILPDSPIYAALEGRVPRPAATYETLAKLVEADERKRINTLIGERRTRLGARLVEVTAEVKSEVFSESPLTRLFAGVIDWTSDDGLRRTYEERLLAHRVERLSAFSGEQKKQELAEVQTLAKGMVIIKHQYQLAWDIVVDWQDFAEVGDWDGGLLWEYRTLFPTSGLGKVLSGFLTSDLAPFAEQKPVATERKDDVSEEAAREPDEGTTTKEDGAEPNEATRIETTGDKEEEMSGRKKRQAFVPLPSTDEDRFALMLDGIDEAKSLLAYRMLALWYEQAEAYSDTIDLMRKALKRLEERRRNTGIAFQNTEDAYALHLATALIYYQTPRNHPEAKHLFETVLAHNATATTALIGIGLIYEEELDYDSAVSFLERALARDSDNLRVRSEAAWVHTLKGNYAHARDEFEACVTMLAERMDINEPRQFRSAQKLLALTHYRLGVCIWDMDKSKAARKDRRKAYSHFLSALKNDLTLACAYTSLGVYYADYGKDRKRANKCFMKAIELSPAELEAGHRLVQAFADKRDWESIELVAKRVIDSGQATPPWGSKKPSHSWPFAALGTAQVHRKEFNKAMMSFRTATRLSQDDYHSFVALAETYLRARMHYSAIRALDQARKIEEEKGLDEGYDRWFTDYLLGNVYRGVGEYDKAIALYQSILETRPNEEGVLIAMMHTMTESAESCLKTGLFSEAVSKATDTLAFAGNIPSAAAESTFGFWTAVASACSVFSTVQGKVTAFPTSLVSALITLGSGGPGAGEDSGKNECEAYKLLQDIDCVGTGVVLAEGLFADEEKVGVDLTRCLHATILAYKRALHVTSAKDVHMLAVAHYNLGWAEYRAHTCLPSDYRAGLNGYLRAAIRSFKRAIELEAGNRKFWNALGVATSAVHPRVSQHAFTRSLYIDGRKADAWANLGMLALQHDDVELANKAFAEGQASDPEYAASWLGQGFVALQYGEAAEARSLFMHAMELSDASTLAARQQYALSVFDALVSDEVVSASADSAANLARPLIALEQVQRLRPQELPYAHLFALFRERIHDKDSTAQILEHICSVLEADFENTESTESLRRVAVAKADLARAYVVLGRYEEAIDASEMALQLASGDGGEFSPAESSRVQLAARLAAGLARFFAKDFDGARTEFAALLASKETDDRNPDAVCLYAQVLWATGDEEAQQMAQDELFSVIETHPDHVQAILLLGVIAVLRGDEESAEAVRLELRDLQAESRVDAGDQARIGDVLQALANPEGQTDAAGRQNGRSQAQRDIMLHPHLPHGWAVLAGEEGEGGEDEDDGYDFASDMALQLTRNLLPPRGALGPEDLAQACVGTGRAADAQVAIFAAPWVQDGWMALGAAVA